MPVPELRRAENGFFYAFWTEGRRSRRKSMGSQDQAVAQMRFAHWLLLDGQTDDGDTDYTVADLWEIYRVKHIERDVAAPDTLAFAWKNLAPHFGPLPLTAINQNVVDDYEARRLAGRIGRPCKHATIRRELAAMRACLNWCAEPKRKILKPAQLPLFDLPAEGEPKDRWLRMEEVQRLLTAAADLRRGNRLSRGERFLWLALETAARREAIAQLTWDRVDFETNVIHFNVPGRRLTKKRRGDTPISTALRPVLERAFSERTGPLVIDTPWNIGRVVKAIAKRAGVVGVSPHVLRHTAATHMARRGVPLWIIAKVLANTTAMVEKVYAKHCPDDLRQAVGLISGGMLEAAE